jgi:hypothetical protein
MVRSFVGMKLPLLESPHFKDVVPHLGPPNRFVTGSNGPSADLNLRDRRSSSKTLPFVGMPRVMAGCRYTHDKKDGKGGNARLLFWTQN